jgi:hypothetical protein
MKFCGNKERKMRLSQILANNFLSAILIGTLIMFCGSAVKGQGRAASKSDSTAELVRWLNTAIEGNAVEIKNQASSNYEKYRYEAFHYGNCNLQWREIHETFNTDDGRTLTTQEVMIPLSIISPSSIRADRVGASVYLVSFNTVGLKAAITAHQKVERADGSKDESVSAQTGYGIYLSKVQTAQRAARSLAGVARPCKK